MNKTNTSTSKEFENFCQQFYEWQKGSLVSVGLEEIMGTMDLYLKTKRELTDKENGIDEDYVVNFHRYERVLDKLFLMGYWDFLRETGRESDE
jgi:hypothetical protein